MHKKKSELAIKKILIIRLSSIGDILLTTPAIRLIKKRFPDADLDFVVKKQFAELVQFHPAIRHIILFDKNNNRHSLKHIKNQIIEEQYDLIVDLHKNFRSFYLSFFSNAQKIVRYRKFSIRRFIFVKFKINLFSKVKPIYQRYLFSLKDFNIQDDDEGLEIFYPLEVDRFIAEKYSDFFEQQFVHIIGSAPGASFATKRWLPEYFEQVIQHLSENAKQGIILFGDHKDRELIDSLNIKGYRNILVAAGDLTLLQTTALMNRCHTVITNDSGLMHVAAALKKKIIAIFGSTTRELGFFPVAKQKIILENNSLSCRPCSHIGRQSCPEKHFKCMTEIKPQQVIDAVENFFHS